MNTLHEQFGDIDIYLFDQILKGRFTPGMKILDAGCGGGRNIIYFLREGYDVYGVDAANESIAYLRRLAHHLAPKLPKENFQTAEIDKADLGEEKFDVVISSAVLHFAEDEDHFMRMVHRMWQQLKPGGMFFARLASNIGIESRVQLLSDRRYSIPDGSEYFLVDEEFLLTITANLKGELIEPIKTTNVQNLRCMTTWVIRKTV